MTANVHDLTDARLLRQITRAIGSKPEPDYAHMAKVVHRAICDLNSAYSYYTCAPGERKAAGNRFVREALNALAPMVLLTPKDPTEAA